MNKFISKDARATFANKITHSNVLTSGPLAYTRNDRKGCDQPPVTYELAGLKDSTCTCMYKYIKQWTYKIVLCMKENTKAHSKISELTK